VSIYITPQDELHVENHGIALTCPHCQTLTHVTATATPKFDDLSHRKPKQIGIVFRCDACGEPIFLKFIAKNYAPMRIELAPNFTEVERARENFPLTYLPEEAEELFREALQCYTACCYNAFGSMSRRTAQSLFRELGDPRRRTRRDSPGSDARSFVSNLRAQGAAVASHDLSPLCRTANRGECVSDMINPWEAHP
jgi:hypothetical protein